MIKQILKSLIGYPKHIYWDCSFKDKYAFLRVGNQYKTFYRIARCKQNAGDCFLIAISDEEIDKLLAEGKIQRVGSYM